MVFFRELPLTIEVNDDRKLRVLVHLYRTVSKQELDDLHANSGRFRDSAHKTGEKGFFFRRSDADSLGSGFAENCEVAQFTVMTQAPATVIERSRIHIAAREGPGVYLDTGDLEDLAPAIEVTA